MKLQTWHDAGQDITPYAHWWMHVEGKSFASARDFVFMNLSRSFDGPVRTASRSGPKRAEDRGGFEPPALAEELILKNFRGGDGVPVPAHSVNPEWNTTGRQRPVPDPVVDNLPDDLIEDTVIVGIIDTGIALGHRNFRRADGTTRVISAWQQTARFDGQSYLPFGRELYQADIDAALREHSVGADLGGRLDEEAFNRATRLVEPNEIRGHRDLDHRAAHGTHVADIAAGCDPSNAAWSDKVRLVVINLPTQALHGSAGDFLMFFGAYAVDRVFQIAEACWHKTFGRVSDGSFQGSFPVSLCFAYGMMAGPKDATNPLEALMALHALRRGADSGLKVSKHGARKGAATSIAMPAGNENQMRAVAHLDLSASAWTDPLDWRTMPSDRTSNYLEFWFPNDPHLLESDLEFRITPPNGKSVHITGARPDHYIDIPGTNGRLYCRVIFIDFKYPLIIRRIGFVLATAPTLTVEPAEPGKDPVPISPAGIWRFQIRSPRDTSVDLYVQSDQSARMNSRSGQRSYFDDAGYRRLGADGRPKDSFAYPCPATGGCKLTENGPVTRVGTHNALASTSHNSAFGGYRATDGRPGDYSATAPDRRAGDVLPIQAAYPTDDGPAHNGVMAAGARDGSSVAIRGTSMAAAQAARTAAEAMLADHTDPRIGETRWHQGEAARAEAHVPGHYGTASDQKIGSGRMPSSGAHRVTRVPRR